MKSQFPALKLGTHLGGALPPRFAARVGTGWKEHLTSWGYKGAPRAPSADQSLSVSLIPPQGGEGSLNIYDTLKCRLEGLTVF